MTARLSKKQFELKVTLIPQEEGRPAAEIDGEVIQASPLSCTRHVYLKGDMIIKVCRPNRWKYVGRQTETEIKLWIGMPEEDRKFFVPLLSWGKTTIKKISWVAQPYLKPDCADPTAKQISDLYGVLMKYGAEDDVILGKYCTLNCMIHDGQPKVFDWGINKLNP